MKKPVNPFFAGDKAKFEGLVPPKFILKFINKNGHSNDTRVYYCHKMLLQDMIEEWGTDDMIL